MNGGIRLGKIFGFEITLDYSWFIIFAIITLALSFSLFPQLLPGLTSATYVVIGIITSILFFASVLFHEMVHSLIARRYGITIAGIRLMVFGGVSQISQEPKTPGVEFFMAVAGPLSSILLGIVFIALYLLGQSIGFSRVIFVPAYWLGYINIFLGIFNLLPGFPLDGGRVFRAAIWYFTGNLRRATSIAAGVGRGIAYLMIFIGIAGPFLLGNLSFVWFILLGWFLLRAAEAEYQQVILHDALEGVKVREVMTQNPETIDANATVEEAVRTHFALHNWVVYPVIEDGNTVGLISIKTIQHIPRSQWGSTRIKDVMRKLSSAIVTGPDAEVFDILPKLSTMADGRMLVMEDGRLVGLLTGTDVTRAIIRRLHLEEETGRPAA